MYRQIKVNDKLKLHPQFLVTVIVNDDREMKPKCEGLSCLCGHGNPWFGGCTFMVYADQSLITHSSTSSF
jgi:hypothetical protein